MRLLKAGHYPFEVALFRGYTREDCLEEVKELNGDIYKELMEEDFLNQSSGGSYFAFETGDCMIWIDEVYKDDISMLVHEIFHFVYYTLKTILAPLNESTEEIYAYLIQNLIYQALEE